MSDCHCAIWGPELYVILLVPVVPRLHPGARFTLWGREDQLGKAVASLASLAIVAFLILATS